MSLPLVQLLVQTLVMLRCIVLCLAQVMDVMMMAKVLQTII
jgi:hypothetical protein